MEANVCACFFGTLILLGSESSTLCSFSRFFLASRVLLYVHVHPIEPPDFLGRAVGIVYVREGVRQFRSHLSGTLHHWGVS